MTVCKVSDIEPGDVFACWGTDWVSRMISAFTANPIGPSGLRWSPSHVAIACAYGERPLWVESTSLSLRACRIGGEPVAGMQTHWAEDRLHDYEACGGRVEVYRFSPIDKLTDNESIRLTDLLIDGFVRAKLRYDFAGAAISGTKFIRLFNGLILRRFRDLEEVFCSEVIAAVLQRLCRLNREDPTRFNPGRLVRRLVAEGTYKRIGRLVT